MSRPPIQSVKLSPHLTLSECHPDLECRVNNWWLYDERAGMNLAMRAKSRDEAFVEVIEYWAERAARYENAYTSLNAQVQAFVGAVNPPDENDEDRDT